MKGTRGWISSSFIDASHLGQADGGILLTAGVCYSDFDLSGFVKVEVMHTMGLLSGSLTE